MARSKKRRPGPRVPLQKMGSLPKEARYIVARAAQYDSRIVTFGSLLFFSTQSGDAWMLDPQDSLALRLAYDGDPAPSRIFETEDTYAVQWDAFYAIKGDEVHITDESGGTKVILGYPTPEIQEASQRIKDRHGITSGISGPS